MSLFIDLMAMFLISIVDVDYFRLDVDVLMPTFCMFFPSIVLPICVLQNVRFSP